jgi:hypothetical protein
MSAGQLDRDVVAIDQIRTVVERILIGLRVLGLRCPNLTDEKSCFKAGFGEGLTLHNLLREEKS